jgi:hypothetical protein
MIAARGDPAAAQQADIATSAVAGAPSALFETVLFLIPVAFAAIVYFPITRNYFFADDFLHIYNIRNQDFLPYLLIPRGGHLLVTNNALFYTLYRIFGTHAEGYYWVAFFGHLINVCLLFWVIRLFTESPRLACFGAVLWGISPMNESAVGWFSVFGQVMVAGFMLFMLVQLGRVAGGRPVHRYAPALWCLLLLAACTSFGIGIGLTLMFPLVAFLLLWQSPSRRRVVLIFCALAVVVPALYFGLTRLTTVLYMPRTAPLFFETNVVTNVAMLAHIVACGIATLLVGQFAPNLEYPSLAAYAVIALFVAGLAAALLTAPAPIKRRLLVCIVLSLGCYGIIVAGRAAFFAAAGRPQAFIRPGRYHYAAPIPLAIALCVLLAYADKRYTLRPEAKTGLLAGWLFLTGLAYAQFGKPINNHIQARRETTAVLSAIRQAIDAAPPGENVYIPNRPFQSLGPIFVKRQDIFPGWAGVFVIFYPDNVVDGKSVFFVTTDRKLIGAAKEGHRTATLIVEPPPPAQSGT